MRSQGSFRRIGDLRNGSGELDALADRLDPSINRRQVLDRFQELFLTGAAPSPLPDGFRAGRLLATSTWSALDGAGSRLARLWMPWKGKSFATDVSMGVNRFSRDARVLLKAVFPAYVPEMVTAERIEAFPFRTSIAPGALDPEVDVLKIDYDFEANPSFIIRRILDELVQLSSGLYLGKVLFWVRGRFHPIGFFSLRSLMAGGVDAG
jgi:hypothetical protein